MLQVVLVAYLELCSANVRLQWPQPPLERKRLHCNGCFLDRLPGTRTCDFQYGSKCTKEAGCLRVDARCLEGPLPGFSDPMRCCCLPGDGVTNTSLCDIVNFISVPFLFTHCQLRCCEHRKCGPGCAGQDEECGEALPPYGGPCRISINATAAQQSEANCCLWGRGVDCASQQQVPCCLEADVHPWQVCQATQAACMLKPTTTTLSPLPANDSALLPAVCSAVLLLLLVAVLFLVCRKRQHGVEGRDRLLREAGPSVSLVEVVPASKRCAIVISCSKFAGGSPSLDDIDKAHEQGSQVCKLFQEELSFDIVSHEKDVTTTAVFWKIIASLLQELDGEPNVLLVLYFITHGVDVDFNLHMAMIAAAPLVLHDEYYLTKVGLQRGFQTIDNASDAERLHQCKPLEYMNLVIFADTCRSPPPPDAASAKGTQSWYKARHLQKKGKPARIGFVHACEHDRPALGEFTEVFLDLAKEPQSLDALIDKMRTRLEANTGAGRQQRVCCDSGSLVLKDIYLHPGSGVPSSSSSTILGPASSNGWQRSEASP